MAFKILTDSNLLPSNVTVIGGKFDGNAYSIGRHLYGLIKRNNTANHLTEGIDFEVSADETGGTIVFSTDVNANPLSENKVIKWVKQSSNLVGWNIGKGLHGKFTVNNSKTFEQNSLSVDLVGVDTDKLLKIATELCNLFTQESVLVKDYNTQIVYFVNGD